MRVVFTALLCVTLAATLPQVSLAAGEPPPLAHNPFSRPSSAAEALGAGLVENNDGSGPTLALRATMVASGSRLANVAGRILQQGDEIDGYRLVEIHEDYAVFDKSGKVMTVFVKPQVTDDNE